MTFSRAILFHIIGSLYCDLNLRIKISNPLEKIIIFMLTTSKNGPFVVFMIQIDQFNVSEDDNFSYYFCYCFLNTEQLSKMFQSFITSLDNNQPFKNLKKVDISSSTGKDSKLREAIKLMIFDMIPSREICTQAAINIGLSTSIIDFQKVLKFIASETSLPSLNFTYMQLKTLHKQCNKLKKNINISQHNKANIRSDLRTNTRKETLISFNQEASKKQKDSNQKMKKALEEELAFRIKVKNLNSKEKLQKKQQILKKRVEKTKSMNKRAFKIYKNYKQKQEQSYDFFKMETLYNESNVTHPQVPPNLASKRLIANVKQTPHDQPTSRQKSCDLLKVSIMRSSYVFVPSQKCKTAVTKLRVRYNQPTTQSSQIRKTSHERFHQYKKRQNLTRTKKEEIERSKQEQALYRLIKKNERLNELQQRNLKQSEDHIKKLQKMHQQSFVKLPISELKEDFDNSIKEKCEQKLVRKEMQLQQQVNRIKENLRIREERRERHKLNQQRQHEEKMSMNQQYLQNYVARCKKIMQNDYKHEMTIKRRHQMLQEKQNQEKIINNLSKFTDQELIKSIEKLNNADHSQSAYNLNIF